MIREIYRINYRPISINFLKLLLLTGVIFLSSCQSSKIPNKINGISLVASRDSLTAAQLDNLMEVNPNAVTLMPYAFLNPENQPDLFFDLKRQWYGERAEGIEQAIKKLQQKPVKIMIKPHLWLRNGSFTGDLNFSSEAEWQKFESAYRSYIFLYAEISEKYALESFCIGTELYQFVTERPAFWKKLISDIREVYGGKLVYAENWDKIDQVNIWEDLDLIGVDAYFPLSEKTFPSEKEISNGWQKHKSLLGDLASRYEKPILFTEYGYRSIDYALKEPWNSERNLYNKNHALQARALMVLYEEFWKEDWFQGGYLWKWHQHEDSGGLNNDRFTPQNKPAEKVVAEYYRKFKN